MFIVAVSVIVVSWCVLPGEMFRCVAGIARLCCDTRRQVRSQALTYLQRALLVHDLQTLSAVEWESCFNKVCRFIHVNGLFLIQHMLR